MTGIDVSDYQPGIDFAALKAGGRCGFVYSKASEGVAGTQDTFRSNHDACKAAGIPFGPYHFFRPYADAAEQAAHFLSTINGYEGQLLPMVDVEVTDGFSAAAIIAALATFNAAVEKTLGGKHIVIYTGLAFWNDEMGGTSDFSGHPLWVAEYNDDEEPTLPSGFTDWVLWQFSDDGTFAGVPGGVDTDRLNGSDLGAISR
jgi:lysozyme